MSPRSHADTSFTNKTGSFDMHANSDWKPNNSPARFQEVQNYTEQAFKFEENHEETVRQTEKTYSQ